MSTELPEASMNTDLLRVGEVIRPNLSESTAREITQRLYGVEVITMKELNSYDDRNYYITVKQEHCNPNMDTPSRDGYVLKILNSMDSKKIDYVEAMQSLILHVWQNDIRTTRPVKSVSGKLMHVEAITAQDTENQDSAPKTKEHIVRLFTYIPGDILVKAPYTARLCYRVGRYAGKLDRKLKTFYNSFYETHGNVWSLRNAPKLAEFLYAVEDVSDRQIVTKVLEKFKEEVIPHYGEFQRGMIHGDLNEQNILIRRSERPDAEGGEGLYEVCGIIDFGDATLSYYLFEVAILICYIMIDSTVLEPLVSGGHALAGYVSEMALTERELAALKACVAARLCQSLVMGAYTYSLDPTNDYVVTTAARGWPCLRQFWSTPEERLQQQWHSIISTYNN